MNTESKVGVNIESKVAWKWRSGWITKDSGLYRGQIIGFSPYSDGQAVDYHDSE